MSTAFHLLSQENPLAIVVGACGHGLALIRALHAGGVPVIALEANPALPGVQTKLAMVTMVSDINGPKLIDALIALHKQIESPRAPVLFLTNDRMIRTIGDGWSRLEGLFKLSWSHSRQALLPLLEKASLEPRCNRQGLAYPKTFVLASAEDVDQAVATIGFPIFVKPARPLSQFKTAQPQTRDELAQLAQTYPNDLPFLIQQCIPGDDTNIYFSALYLDHGKILARFDGRKLRSRPLGHTTVAEAVINHEVFEQTRKFFDGLDLSGPVSLELKRDELGRFWVIEPTVGRTDFWTDLCTVNGINLPLIEYQHQTGSPLSAPIQKNQAVWFNEERDPFGRLWFLSQPNLRLSGRVATYLFLHHSDPKPALLALKNIIASLTESVIRRVRRVTATLNDTLPKNVSCFKLSDEFPNDIHHLFSHAECQDVELGLDWYRNLVQTVYKNDDVLIYVLRENGRPVAAMPVHVIKRFLVNEVRSLSNFYTTFYAPVLASELSPDGLAILIAAIRNAHSPVGSFRFDLMNPQAHSFSNLNHSFRMLGLRPFQYFCTGNWYLPVVGNSAKYIQERDGLLRSTIKRMSKKFAAAGGTIEITHDGINLDRGLAAYQKVYASSWKAPEPYPEFIPGLLRACAKRGWLRLGVAWLDHEPIAAQFWIVANGKANIYKLAYDKNFKAYAPGTLLTAMLMAHVIDKDSVTEVDYLIGDDPYKKAWMTHRRERWGIIAYNPKTINGTIGLLKEVFSRTLKNVIKPNRPTGKGTLK